MATVRMAPPVHDFHQAPWVILAATILLPILATIGVFLWGVK